MLLKFDDDELFATGMASYNSRPIPGSDDANRTLVQIEVENELKEAILDTGGQYFFCTKDLAKSIMETHRELLLNKRINLRGAEVEGSLCLVDITLCIERVRFAIDPSRDENRFYFGECSG